MKRFFLFFLLATSFFKLFAKESSSWDVTKKELQEKVKQGKPADWALSQIRSDLAPFQETGISTRLLKEAMEEDRGLVHYRIQEGKLSVLACNPSCADSGLNFRYQTMKNHLMFLCESVKIPDVEFIVCLHDAADDFISSSPLFAFAKKTDVKHAIVIPDFEVLSDQSKLLKELKKGIGSNPWNQKISKAYWRGATTGGLVTESNFLDFPRAQAVKASLRAPLLVDAKFTNLVQCEEEKKVKQEFSSYFGDHTSVEHHLKYKYQLLLDGNSCAYLRAYWQLFSNCAVFKHESCNIQWYYGGLKPYIHYIPLENKVGDLIEKVQWAKAHDLQVQKIVENAQLFARENLKRSDIFYYLYLLLSEYALLQKGDMA